MTGIAEDTPNRRPAKSEAAFRTISEVSEDLNVPQHVLRFWESKFSQIKPMKRGGGRRYYRPEDVALLLHIRDLLYKDGYTIRGAQRYLREAGHSPAAKESTKAPRLVKSSATPPAQAAETVKVVDKGEAAGQQDELRALLAELIELKSLLSEARGAEKG